MGAPWHKQIPVKVSVYRCGNVLWNCSGGIDWSWLVKSRREVAVKNLLRFLIVFGCARVALGHPTSIRPATNLVIHTLLSTQSYWYRAKVPVRIRRTRSLQM
jgi:hypothetical protein